MINIDPLWDVRICSKCKDAKMLSDFSRDYRNKRYNKYRTICKTCYLDMASERRHTIKLLAEELLRTKNHAISEPQPTEKS